MKHNCAMTLQKVLPGGRLSTGQAAKVLECSISYIRTIPKEDLGYVKIGNRRRYLLDDLVAYRRSKLSEH